MRLVAYLTGVALLAFASYWAATVGASQGLMAEAGADERPVLLAQNTGAPPPVQTTIDPATPATQPAAPAAPAPVDTDIPDVDETALRYFAQQGDTERLQREIQRLRALYPGWQPPADPLAQDDFVADQSIIRMWELFNAGDYAGARAAIATKQETDPSFVPSPDLLESLDLAEAGVRLVNASDAGSFQTVISIAANTPELLTCANVDALWRLAEAFADTDNAPRAVDAYSYVLTNCTDAAERYATMQKAIDHLERDALEPLLALERPGADGAGEFADLRVDLARRAIAASLEEDGAAALPADVDLLETTAEQSGSAEDLRLLGYYQLDRSRTNEARRLFERALEADPSAASAEALGVALLQLRDAEEAEAVLAEYRDENDTIAALYLDAAAALLSTQPRLTIDEEVLGRIVDTVMSSRDGNTAQELGWYAYAFEQPQTAVEWFTLALRWQTDLEPAAYGLMVASDALGDEATVESIRNQWGARSARIADFGTSTETSSTTGRTAPPPLPEPRPERPQEAARQQAAPVRSSAPAPTQTAAAAAPRTSSGARGCQAYVPPASLSADAALNHAWCLMQLNRPAQAVDHFARALQSGSESTRSDAAYGQSLAYIRLGLPENAAVAATSAPLTGSRANELEISILTQQATTAFDMGEYRRALDLLDRRSLHAAERNDLLTLRAWSYFHLRRFAEAQRIFEAVAATGYGDAVAGLQASTDALRAASQ